MTIKDGTIMKGTHMKRLDLAQDTDASEDKLQVCVTMADEISLRKTHLNGFDSVQDTDAEDKL